MWNVECFQFPIDLARSRSIPAIADVASG